MPFIVNAECRDDILFIHTTGDFSLENVKNSFFNILEMLKEYNLNKVLLDCRDLKNIPYNMSDAFDYSEYSSSALFNKLNNDDLAYPKFAYLFKPDDFHNLDSIETLGVNRGVRMKIFQGEQQAINWLKK